MILKIENIHHVAYRCNDAKETVLWYQRALKMDFVLAIAEDLVPSTKAPDPYMHVFLDAGAGNVLAFFELPTRPPMGRDANTPNWVQHIAFKVRDRETLLGFKSHLEAEGIDVLGVTDHGAFHSIYFFDPNGHRVELACPDPDEDNLLRRLDAVKWDMLEDWSRTKRAAHASCQRGSQLSQCDRDRRRPGLVLAVSRLFPVGRNDLERLAAGSGPAPRRGVQLCLGRRAHASRHFS